VYRSESERGSCDMSSCTPPRLACVDLLALHVNALDAVLGDFGTPEVPRGSTAERKA